MKEKIIAGSSLPNTPEAIKYIKDQGIKLIISAAHADTVSNLLEKDSIKHLNLEFADLTVPSRVQLKAYFSTLSKAIKLNEPVLIHCRAGCGRTGLLLALFLIYFHDFSNETSIQEVRKIRPCSIELKRQEEFVKHFIRERVDSSRIFVDSTKNSCYACGYKCLNLQEQHSVDPGACCICQGKIDRDWCQDCTTLLFW